MLQALACLRAIGMGIEDMRTYQANRARGRAAAAEQRDLLLRHSTRIVAEIETLHAHLDYLREKAALWDARDRGDAAAAGRHGSASRPPQPGGKAIDEPVLVTGASGYLGTQVIAALLRGGAARCAPRSARRPARTAYARRSAGAMPTDAALRSVAAELTSDQGWAAALDGCPEVDHTASPMIQPKDPDEVLSRPGKARSACCARRGTPVPAGSC